MEQPYDNIRFFVSLDDGHPFLCARDHFFKSESAPQALVQPVRYGRSQHAEYGYFDTCTVEYGVWFKVRSVGVCVCHVCPQHRTFRFLYPLVIDGMPGFHIMVSDGLGIIFHIVDDTCGDVGLLWIHEVAVIAGRLSLQDITVVQ